MFADSLVVSVFVPRAAVATPGAPVSLLAPLTGLRRLLDPGRVHSKERIERVWVAGPGPAERLLPIQVARPQCMRSFIPLCQVAPGVLSHVSGLVGGLSEEANDVTTKSEAIYGSCNDELVNDKDVEH